MESLISPNYKLWRPNSPTLLQFSLWRIPWFRTGLTKFCLSESTAAWLGISGVEVSLFSLARDPVSSISRKTLQQMCKNVARDSDRCHWDSKLDIKPLLFRINLKISATLSWKIMFGIKFKTVYRLFNYPSFLELAQTLCLLHSTWIKRWRLKVDSKCHLCGSSAPATFHILNFDGCPVALSLFRYTLRYDSVLWKFDRVIRSNLSDGEHLFSDLSGLIQPTGYSPSCTIWWYWQPDLI